MHKYYLSLLLLSDLVWHFGGINNIGWDVINFSHAEIGVLIPIDFNANFA